MTFPDQLQHTATADDLKLPWSGRRDGSKFRCHLCGHKFQAGDKWRWVFGGKKTINFFTCEKCDGPDVLERFARKMENLKVIKDRYWFLEL